MRQDVSESRVVRLDVASCRLDYRGQADLTLEGLPADAVHDLRHQVASIDCASRERSAGGTGGHFHQAGQRVLEPGALAAGGLEKVALKIIQRSGLLACHQIE